MQSAVGPDIEGRVPSESTGPVDPLEDSLGPTTEGGEFHAPRPPIQVRDEHRSVGSERHARLPPDGRATVHKLNLPSKACANRARQKPRR